jgi:hypothetical protein
VARFGKSRYIAFLTLKVNFQNAKNGSMRCAETRRKDGKKITLHTA